MGWFGPTIKERNKHGRIEFYGKCEECGKEQSDTVKKSVERNLESCAKSDKKDKDKKDAAALRTAKAKIVADNQTAQKQRQREMDRLKQQRLNTAKELRRAAKGKKCPWCGKKPCKGTKPKCAAMGAAEFESAFNIDVSDPATFDAQMKFYKEQMGPYRDSFYSDE